VHREGSPSPALRAPSPRGRGQGEGDGSWGASTPNELARHGAMNLVFVTRWKSTERSDGSWRGGRPLGILDLGLGICRRRAQACCCCGKWPIRNAQPPIPNRFGGALIRITDSNRAIVALGIDHPLVWPTSEGSPFEGIHEAGCVDSVHCCISFSTSRAVSLLVFWSVRSIGDLHRRGRSSGMTRPLRADS
jgi:hypothetical protein